MKRFFPFLLLIVMMANVSVSLVEQLRERALCELTEMSADDADEKSKTEKEKESFTVVYHIAVGFDAFNLNKLKKSLLFCDDRLRSELHASSPYLPPEA